MENQTPKHKTKFQYAISKIDNEFVKKGNMYKFISAIRETNELVLEISKDIKILVNEKDYFLVTFSPN